MLAAARGSRLGGGGGGSGEASPRRARRASSSASDTASGGLPGDAAADDDAAATGEAVAAAAAAAAVHVCLHGDDAAAADVAELLLPCADLHLEFLETRAKRSDAVGVESVEKGVGCRSYLPILALGTAAGTPEAENARDAPDGGRGAADCVGGGCGELRFFVGVVGEKISMCKGVGGGHVHRHAHAIYPHKVIPSVHPHICHPSIHPSAQPPTRNGRSKAEPGAWQSYRGSYRAWVRQRPRTISCLAANQLQLWQHPKAQPARFIFTLTAVAAPNGATRPISTHTHSCGSTQRCNPPDLYSHLSHPALAACYILFAPASADALACNFAAEALSLDTHTHVPAVAHTPHVCLGPFSVGARRSDRSVWTPGSGRRHSVGQGSNAVWAVNTARSGVRSAPQNAVRVHTDRNYPPTPWFASV
eukprot:364088-Chlamydomonas_euryale.AAC.5